MEWEKHNGRILRIEGLSWKLRVVTYRAIYPYERMVTTVSLDPTPATKRSNHYKQIKRDLGDDWSTDVLSSDVAFQVELIQQLEAA